MLMLVLSVAGILLFCFIIIVLIESMTFKNMVGKEIDILIGDSDEGPFKTFKHSDLKGLPEPVQKYFRNVLKYGTQHVRYARLEQTGLFKMEEDADWNPVTAEEYFATPVPSFIWKAKMKLSVVMWVRVRGLYQHGRGGLLGKLFSTITVVNSKGREMDSSSLFRFLSGAVWFPTALLESDYLSWEKINKRSARATIKDHGHSVSAVFHFNGKGEITRIVTGDNYRAVDSQLRKEQWTGRYRSYREFGGMKIPTEVDALWNLKKRDYKYSTLKLTAVEYR